jgi:hypothetical protein
MMIACFRSSVIWDFSKYQYLLSIDNSTKDPAFVHGQHLTDDWLELLEPLAHSSRSDHERYDVSIQKIIDKPLSGISYSESWIRPCQHIPKQSTYLGLNDVTQPPQPPDPPLYPKEEGEVLNTRLYYAETNLDNAFSVQIQNVGVCILHFG